MSARNLKFAVVREDPALEARLIARLDAKAVVLVASGGCTALSLSRLHPALEVVAFDLNSAQLAHVEDKRAAAAAGDLARLNVEDDRAEGLNQKGAFEGLFRVLRGFLEEFVTTREEIASVFSGALDERTRLARLEEWFRSPYWPAAFGTTFNDAFLVAMFGPEAIQHAAPGSYPAYFQSAFERGLSRADASRNPFLQHILLGFYRRDDAPPYVYVGGASSKRPTLVRGSLLDVEDLARFELFSLSNVFDWSTDGLVEEWARTLARHARPGSAILIRQLNNRRDLRHFFRPAFAFDDDLGRDLLALDRSLFYERIEVGFRT
jgi:S-adenosylmethionine-diacylglycerol 3-amino-3-carboxypropyl transferase